MLQSAAGQAEPQMASCSPKSACGQNDAVVATGCHRRRVRGVGTHWAKVDLARLGSKAEAAIMLLAFVLRDLCEGWISVGHGTTRGYGEIEADPSQVSLNWPEDDYHVQHLTSLFDDESGAVFREGLD